MRLGIWDSESETLEVAVGLSLAFYRGALWTSDPQSDCKESSISDGDADRTAGTVLVGVPVLSPTRQPGPRD